MSVGEELERVLMVVLNVLNDGETAYLVLEILSRSSAIIVTSAHQNCGLHHLSSSSGKCRTN